MCNYFKDKAIIGILIFFIPNLHNISICLHICKYLGFGFEIRSVKHS